MNKKKVNQRANGFMIMDVVIGMVVLLIGVMGIAGVYMQSSRSSLMVDNRRAANNWAQARMEYLKSDLNWRTGVTTGEIILDPENDAPPRATFTRETKVVAHPATLSSLPSKRSNGDDGTGAVKDAALLEAVNNRLIDVQVTVSWKEKDISQSVSLETLIDQK